MLQQPHDGSSVSRRDFVRHVGTAALAGGILLPSLASAADKKSNSAETKVKALYDSLSDKQKATICLPFDHPSRSKINANWAITQPTISDDFYTKEQRETISQIFQGITSEDGYERLLKQTDDDAGGWDEYHVAIFGDPHSDLFEFTLTGRHLTLRADGNTIDGVAFGGPLVYGHGIEVPKENIYHYQTQQANEVFGALEGKQRQQALLKQAPRETDVLLQGANGKFAGIEVGSMSQDQQELVERTIEVLLAPYRETDVTEAMAFLKEGGGIQKLRMAFYQQGDLENDKVWDIWRIEGPNFVSHFRGAPHVHAYLNVGMKKA